MDILRDWFGTFWKILISPTPKTFLSESGKAKGKFPSAVAWILLDTALMIIYDCFFLKMEISIPIIIATVVFFPIVFFAYIFFLNLLYKSLFHRKKDLYPEILYLVTSIFFPWSFVQALIVFIPRIGSVLGWILFLYPICLITIALKTISKLKYWESSLVVILSTLMAGLSLVCIPAFFMNLLFTVPNVF